MFWKEGKKEYECEKKNMNTKRKHLKGKTEKSDDSWGRRTTIMKSRERTNKEQLKWKSGWWKDNDILCVTYFLYGLKILFWSEGIRMRYEWKSHESGLEGNFLVDTTEWKSEWSTREELILLDVNEWRNSMVWLTDHVGANYDLITWSVKLN